MKLKWVGMIIAFSVFAGCQSTGALRRANDSPYAPTGDSRNAGSIDGLLVGHRLMAAGEYELALKAYYRAAGELGLTTDVYSALGSANLKLGRLGQSEKLLRQAIKSDEGFAPA